MQLSMYGVTPNYTSRSNGDRKMVNVDIELDGRASFYQDGACHIVLTPEDALALALTIMEVIPHETTVVDVGDEDE